jgi:hypothetical protein
MKPRWQWNKPKKQVSEFYRKFPKIKIKRSVDLVKKLDIVFSKYKRLSALTSQGYIRCFTCGGFFTLRQIDCGHYIGREHMGTRWEERNTAPQCHTCNRFREGQKDIFAQNLQKKYGIGILEWLNDKKNKITQFSSNDLEDMIEEYKTKIKNLGNKEAVK